MKVIDQINGSALFAHSAYSASIATKDDLGRDITATYLTSHQDLSDYQTIAGMTAYQPVGDYYSASNPSGFIVSGNLSGYVKYSDTLLNIGSNNTTDDMGNDKGVFAQGISNTAKLDSFAQGEENSAFNSLSQGFNNKAYSWSLAQGRDNTAKNTSLAQGNHNTADQFSLAQGNYNNSQVFSIAQGEGNAASNYSQAFGRNTIANNSGMAIGTYNQTTTAAFVIGNGVDPVRSDAFIVYHDGSVSAAGKISANGVELGAGGDVPEDVMVESAVGYNAVNEISGYNGSAIAQYGAEKQWLVHDDTLVHASNSAQYALGVAIDNVARLMGVDETVLYSGTTNTSPLTASEPLSSFEKVEIVWEHNWNNNVVNHTNIMYEMPSNELLAYGGRTATNGFTWFIAGWTIGSDGKTLTRGPSKYIPITTAIGAPVDNNNIFPIKIIGIGRKN